MHHEIVVVGGGPAALTLSYYLSARNQSHIIFERERIGENWRSQRWDSLRLVGPNWHLQLPEYPYTGDDPNGFMHRDEVVTYIEQFAGRINAPVRCGVAVTAITPHPNGFALQTTAGDCTARQVVVATGAYGIQQPPPLSADLPAALAQITSSQYRRPDALPAGAVLVVGSGTSGCQIAEELARNGRTVFLAVGSAPWIPRRYRGRDTITWVTALGALDQTVDTLPEGHARHAPVGPQQTGKDGGHDINLHTLAHDGVTLVGRLTAVRGDTLVFADDLAQQVAQGDAFAAEFCHTVDDYIAMHGIDAPKEASPHYTAALDAPHIGKLSVEQVVITSVVWATGFRPQFDWVHLPAFDEHGYPVHQRGVAAYSGLFFVGLEWQHKAKSSVFQGLGEDAAYVAAAICAERQPA